MADLKREAKRARKQVEGLDLSVDLGRLRERLPSMSDFDWNIIQQREDAAATRGFFSGLALGAILGVVLALIFAPQRGEETRGMVVEKATDLVHQVRGDADQARDDLAAQGPAIERELGDTADDLAASAEAGVDELQTRY